MVPFELLSSSQRFASVQRVPTRRCWLARAAAGAVLAWAAVAGAQPGPAFVDCNGQRVSEQPGDWRVVAVGDIVLTESEAANRDAFKAFLPIFSKADLVIGNLEGAITEHRKPRKAYVPGRTYIFRFPPGTGQLLKDANFHVISIANNHAYDYGPIGFADTQKNLAEAGVQSTGLKGSSLVRQVRGLKVAVLTLAHYPIFNNVLDIEAAARQVAELKAANDVVVLSYQLGAEGDAAARLPAGPETFLSESRGDARAFARRMAQAGASFLVGHGPHVVRAAECVEGGVPALHSVGNFVSAGGLSAQRLSAVAGAAEALFSASGQWRGVRVHPVAFSAAKMPLLDPAGKAVHLINQLSRETAAAQPGFRPLTLDGYAEGEAEFRAWLATVPPAEEPAGGRSKRR